MRPADCQSTVLELVAQLDTETLLSRMREFTKAGYPGASMSDGRGSAETPCPVREDKKTGVLGPADQTDRDLRADRLEYEQALRFMVTAAQRAVGITNKYLIARSTDEVKEQKLAPAKGSGPCGNVFCEHVCEGTANDRLRKAPKRSGDDPAKATVARCVTCDRWWRRHGTERDPRRELSPVTSSTGTDG